MLDRLLIIDDDEAIGQLYASVGETIGYAVRATNSPDAFWQAVEKWSPSVILLDLRMPRIDGIEILRGLADRRAKARILLASGSEPSLLETVQRIGRERGLAMSGVLAKPVGPSHLRGVLTDLKTTPHPITVDEIRGGIERGEFDLAYQPKIDLRDGHIVGVEALIRWHHPTRGNVAPNDFISIAEASGLIDGLTDIVFDKALAQFVAWRCAGFDMSVAINLSPINLRDLAFPERLKDTCDERGIAPGSLILELTETAAHDDHTTLMDILTRLRLRDLHLSIDDFGTGHSSLFKLHTLPFSELKLDRSFIVEARASSRALIIIKATIDLAHALGMAVVAEGIEDRETATLLRDIGCDIGQGFHFSRPLAGDAMLEYLLRRHPRTQPTGRLVLAAKT